MACKHAARGEFQWAWWAAPPDHVSWVRILAAGARLQPPLEEELLRVGAGVGVGRMAGKVPGSCTREVGAGPSHGGAKLGEVVQEGKDAPGLEGACGEPEA